MSKNKSNLIKFTDIFGVPKEYYPVPASKIIPDWYKDVDSYVDGKKVPTEKGDTSSTIKRCMPVFDSICSGYIIMSYVDIWVDQLDKDGNPKEVQSDEETQPYYRWPSLSPINFHSVKQAPNHPLKGTHKISYPKWKNPWAIKTPPGYSCLFITPMHRDLPFTILPGVVDTDTYSAPVNFPFVLNNAENFSGLIPAGTPIAQVIPFKRESWEIQFGNQQDIIDQQDITIKLRTKFFDSYKDQYRQLKEYK